MGKLYEAKGYLVKFYGKYSMYIDKILKFLLAFLTFTFINQNTGFLKLLSSPVIALILSVICMFLPLNLTVVMGSMVMLMQYLTLSPGIALAALMVFLVIYAFYFRYAKEYAVILLLMPIATMLGIPVVIPIVFGLLGETICILPITLGTLISYMATYVSANATTLSTVGETGMMGQIQTITQQLLTSNEMWCTIIAFAVCLLLVHAVRVMSVDYSWELGIIAGALGNANVMAYGYILLDIKFSYLSLIVGSLVSIVLALIVKFFAFSVHYSRTESLQFEDDEYYYYVKAVPKVTIATPEKKVKKIHEKQKTGVIDAEQVKKLEQMQQDEEDSDIQRIIDEELNQEK